MKNKHILPPCHAGNSLTEHDLKISEQQGFLEWFTVLETEAGFYIVADAHSRSWYVVTRRNRDKPRMYQNLHRLNQSLREQFGEIGFTLIRNGRLPDEGAPKDKAITISF